MEEIDPSIEVSMKEETFELSWIRRLEKFNLRHCLSDFDGEQMANTLVDPHELQCKR